MIGLSRLWSWLTVSDDEKQSVDSDKEGSTDDDKSIELNVTVEELTISSDDGKDHD